MSHEIKLINICEFFRAKPESFCPLFALPQVSFSEIFPKTQYFFGIIERFGSLNIYAIT